MRLPFTLTRGIATRPVPATWPNRAVRRALRYGKQLPRDWASFFTLNPKAEAAVRGNFLA